jgi:hypothetical protein
MKKYSTLIKLHDNSIFPDLPIENGRVRKPSVSRTIIEAFRPWSLEEHTPKSWAAQKRGVKFDYTSESSRPDRSDVLEVTVYSDECMNVCDVPNFSLRVETDNFVLEINNHEHWFGVSINYKVTKNEKIYLSQYEEKVVVRYPTFYEREKKRYNVLADEDRHDVKLQNIHGYPLEYVKKSWSHRGENSVISYFTHGVEGNSHLDLITYRSEDQKPSYELSCGGL